MNINFGIDQATAAQMRDGARKGIKLLIGFFIFICAMFGPLIFVVCLAGEMEEGASRIPGIVLGSIFTVIMIVLVVILIRMNLSDRLVRIYVSTVGNIKRVELKWLSDNVGKPIDKVVEDLRKVMRRGYFKDGHLDVNNKVLLFPNVDLGAEISIICSQCGAVVKAQQGYPADCPYCGTVVQ